MQCNPPDGWITRLTHVAMNSLKIQYHKGMYFLTPVHSNWWEVRTNLIPKLGMMWLGTFSDSTPHPTSSSPPSPQQNAHFNDKWNDEWLNKAKTYCVTEVGTKILSLTQKCHYTKTPMITKDQHPSRSFCTMTTPSFILKLDLGKKYITLYHGFTHWLIHQLLPCWWKELLTSCRKHPHQLLQWLELKIRNCLAHHIQINTTHENIQWCQMLNWQ